MKKVVSVLVALAVLMTATLTVSATHIGSAAENIGAVVSDALLRAEFEKLSAAQQDAVDAYEILFKSFEKDGDNNRIYPQEYAGAHIEDNVLHIHIVDLRSQDVGRYRALLADYLDDIVFVDAEYSLDELKSKAADTYNELKAKGVKVTGYHAKQQYNAVGIVVDPSENEKLNMTSINHSKSQFYTLERSEEDVPVYIEFEEIPQECLDLQGGTPLMTGLRSGYTLGVCGIYEEQPVIAMCGHGLSNIGQRIYHQLSDGDAGTQIGTIMELQYDDYEDGDYAIVSNSQNLPIRPVMGNPNSPDSCYPVTGGYLLPCPGTVVVKYGSRAGFAYGVVNEVDCYTETTSYNDLLPEICVITGLVRVLMTSGRVQRGDSGGPVFTESGLFCGTLSSCPLNNMNGTADAGDDYGTHSYYFSPFVYLSDLGFEVRISL